MTRYFWPTLILLSAIGVAQPAPPATKPPSLTDAQRAHFFRAQAELLQATEQSKAAAQFAQQKQAAFQAIVTELKTACGAAELSIDKGGDLVCEVKVVERGATK